ncbi:MAG: MBOAT family protein [Proteobacteria bacterium]|nr:MBOAT family protein [Pseudomonadota bacterium]
MAFNSFSFLLWFLPLALAGYAAASRGGARWAKLWLIVMSLLFYACGAWRSIPVLLLSVAGNVVLLHVIAAGHRYRAWLAATGVVANLALLGWFKYAVPVLGVDTGLPLGISFFTFVQIGSLLSQAFSDEPAPRTWDQVLFVLFFPTITSGPILNSRETMPQFARSDSWRLTATDLSVGSGFFIIGLLKKGLLADPLGPLVADGFANADSLTLPAAWWTAVAWSLQLYFDFSGYTDMAIGLGWMFGFRLPDNFDQPYKARCVIDYWQRWHMSLTRFLMNNVHAPLTLTVLRWRRRRDLAIDDKARRTASGFVTMMVGPILVTMLLIGVWHGPRWTYVLFGLLHAMFLLVNHAWRLWRGPVLPTGVAVALTYGAVLVGAVLFRASTPTEAAAVLAGMTGAHGIGYSPADVRPLLNALWVAALFVVIWFAPTTRQFMLRAPGIRLSWAPTPRWAAAFGCGVTLGILAAGGTGEFVYFRF